MKKLIFTTIVSFAAFITTAQIKVNSGGPIATGYTTAVTSGYSAQIKGSTLFTSATGTISTSTSAAAIIGANGYSSASAPDYTWNGNSNTGIYHPTSNEINFSTNGTQRAQLTQWELNLMNLQYGLKISAAGTWPNTQIIVSSSTYTNAAAVYGYVMTYGGADKFYVQATGDIWYKNGYVGSDSSFKKNVTPVSSAMKKLNKIRGVTFKYNYSDSGLNDPNETAIGVIAQEVQRVMPEAVKKSKDGTLAVNYQGLIGLLIEGMKEQNKRLDSLQQQLNTCCPPPKTGQRTINPNNNGGQKSGGNLQISIGDLQSARLEQNNPNPFNQTTNIKCFIPETSKKASLLIFDMNGTLKKTLAINGTGDVNLTIHANQFIAGMYYYSLIIDGNEIDTKKMILTEQ